ncbi:hypothetical protein CAEBREN_05638 [Caenorhabditis brenneri]|uniref:Sdz-33 F-box domain-containing protein n=1 Tax=Caenorhabditis brenneri TaxID=135651 RepID=G0NAD7_CAEBE|nr:hypothetical protein CAEBREN_05638 [Caenorhabditis brenneri]
MSSQGFPILKLPFLALAEAIVQFSDRELIYLSILSHRAQHLVRRLQKSKPDISLLSDVPLNSRSKDKKCHVFQVLRYSKRPKDAKMININGEKVPGEVNGFIIRSYWHRKIEGLCHVADHVRRTFNVDFYEVLVGNNPFGSALMDFFRGIGKSKPPKTFQDHDSAVQYFLGSCVAQETFKFSMSPKNPEKFKFQGTLASKNVDTFETSSRLFRLPELFSLNCAWIYLDHSALTNSQIGEFLEHWIHGGCPNLEQLRMQHAKEYLRLGMVLKGFRVYETDIRRNFKFIGRGRPSDPSSFLTSYDVRRHDGRRASVWTSVHMPHEIHISVQPFVHTIEIHHPIEPRNNMSIRF